MSLLDLLSFPWSRNEGSYVELIKESHEHQRKVLEQMSFKVPKEEPKVEHNMEEAKEGEPKFEFEPDRVSLEEYTSLKRTQNPKFNPLDTSMVFRLTQEEVDRFVQHGSLILNIDCRNGHLEYRRDMFNCPSDRINTIILLKEHEDGE